MPWYVLHRRERRRRCQGDASEMETFAMAIKATVTAVVCLVVS